VHISKKKNRCGHRIVFSLNNPIRIACLSVCIEKKEE